MISFLSSPSELGSELEVGMTTPLRIEDSVGLLSKRVEAPLFDAEFSERMSSADADVHELSIPSFRARDSCWSGRTRSSSFSGLRYSTSRPFGFFALHSAKKPAVAVRDGDHELA